MVLNEEKLRIQRECLTALEEAGFNASFFLPTGAGKAKILVDAAKKLYRAGMIDSITYVCDNREMRDEDWPLQMKLWGAEELLDITTTMCYATAYKMQKIKTGLRIFDEADYAAGTQKLAQSFERIEADFTLICSATGTEEQKSYLNNIAPIVFERDLRELEEAKVLNKSKYFFINYMMTRQENRDYLDLTKEIAVTVSRYGMQSDHSTMIMLKRKHFLSGLFSSRLATKELLHYIKTHNPKDRILVFSQLTEQSDKIVTHTFHEKNAKENKLKLFNNTDIDILGVCGKIIRGKNLYEVRHLIHEAVNSSSTRMVQASGRGKRLDINEISYNYFMIPHFVKPNNKVYSTVVEDWVIKSIQKLNIDYLREHWINY